MRYSSIHHTQVPRAYLQVPQHKSSSNGGDCTLPSSTQPTVAIMSTLPNGKVAFSPTATYTLSNKAFGPDSTLSIDNSQGRGMTMHMVRSSGAPGPLAFTVKPSAGMADHFNLCTTHTASGSDNPETVCLDVFGNDKSKPHLASQAAVTGQQWRVQPAKGVQDAYRLSNAFSGDDVFMDVTPTGDADGKVDGAGGPGQLWVFNEVSGAQAAGTPGSNGTAGASGVIGPTVCH